MLQLPGRRERGMAAAGSSVERLQSVRVLPLHYSYLIPIVTSPFIL